MAVVLRTILTVIFAVGSVALIVVVLMQEGKQSGLGALSGQTTSDTYWGKNKGRSAEGNLKKFTRFLAVLFIVLAIVLNINF